MFKIAICDDDINEHDRIREYFSSYCITRNIEGEKPHKFASAEEVLTAPFDYDILFLDIMLDNKNDGIEIGKKLRRMGNNAKFIIITSWKDRAYDAYGADVFQFLVKPITKEAFHAVLDAYFESINRSVRNKVTIAVKFRNELNYIPIEDIIAIESRDHCRYFITENSQYRTKDDWDAILEILNGTKQFFRLKRSALINLGRIHSRNPSSITMINGVSYSFAKKGRKEIRADFEEKYTSYLSRKKPKPIHEALVK